MQYVNTEKQAHVFLEDKKKKNGEYFLEGITKCNLMMYNK